MPTKLVYPTGVESRTHFKFSAKKYTLPTVAERADFLRAQSSSTSTDSESIRKTAENNAEVRGDSNSTPPVILDSHPDFPNVHLYIPGGYGYTNTAEWSEKNLTYMGSSGDALKKVSEGVNKGAFAGASALAGVVGDIAKGAINQKATGMVSTLASTDLGTSVTASAGLSIAPNESKIFTGGSYTDLPLSFSFYPKDRSEGATMVAIIEHFRQAAVPKIGGPEVPIVGAVLFYEYPPVFDIKIVDGALNTVSSNQFSEYKNMALTSFSVSYANESSTFTHYEGGIPTDATISLSFTSLFQMTRD